MRRPLLSFLLGCVLLFLATIGRAGTVSEMEMADRIDMHLAEAWTANDVEPGPVADDAEFLRRAWLDLVGIIPPVHNNGRDGDYGVSGFLEDRRPDKRARLIDHLLSKPRHAAHFANIWMDLMIPVEANARQFGRDGTFKNWLRHQFADNVPYDRMVADLLLTKTAATENGPALFYTALSLKSDELAAKSSRFLLGIQIECAQCHDHPFDKWKQKDFWSYSAFFARIGYSREGEISNRLADTDRGDVKFPNTDEVALPRFFDGQVSLDNDVSQRQRLADWLISGENPYFARATVNRIWALLFGRGIVDPVDDLGQHNVPSHPALLDELTDYFVQTGFDVNCLIRTLTFSRAYHLSGKSLPGSEERPDLFAHMALKSLTAAQLYDCLAEATRRRDETMAAAMTTYGTRRVDQNRVAFFEKFGAPGQAVTDYSSGIPQALSLMNGTLVRQATDISESDILIALDAPFLTDEQRVETLFMSTLSRLPHEFERDKFVAYAKKRSDEQRRSAMGDILWALLNSAEFALNH